MDAKPYPRFLIALISILTLSIGLAYSAPSTVKLDSNAVRALYLDGDFEQAIEMLENVIKNKKLATHSDSLFAYKHLGVMYAANEQTREKGKYYMVQLLILEPTVRIMDMYASDMIYMIFKNIKEEFEDSRFKLQRAEQNVAGNRKPAAGSDIASADTTLGVKPVKNEKALKEKSKNSHIYYWLGGGAALAGLGVVTYMILDEEPAVEKDIREIN